MEPIEQEARRAHNQVIKGLNNDIKIIAEKLKLTVCIPTGRKTVLRPSLHGNPPSEKRLRDFKI